MDAVRGGAGGDRGDRAAGAGDDAEPGRHLHPGLVHVEHLGTVPVPVRHHRGGRHPGEPARVVHADADDERAAAPRASMAMRHGRRGTRARGFYRHIDRVYTRALGVGAAAPARLVAVVGRAGDRSRSIPLYGLVRQEFVPTDVDEAEFEVQRHRARRHEHRRRWTTSMRRIERELRADPRRAHRAGDRRRRLPRQRQPGAGVRRASRRTRSGCSRSAGWCKGHRHAASRWRRSRATTAARRDAAGPRQAAQVPRPARRRPQRAVVQHRRRQPRDRLRHPGAGAGRSSREYAEELRAQSARARHRRRRHHAQARQARAARARSTASAPPTSACSTAGHRDRAAADGRRRRGGLALPRRAGRTRTTTSSCG